MYVDPHLLIIMSRLLESLFLFQSDPIKQFALHETNLVLTIHLTMTITNLTLTIHLTITITIVALTIG
jgi:hypothetical protein